jgi:HSP20 family protein
MRSMLPSFWNNDRNDPMRSLQDEINRAFGRFGQGVPSVFGEMRFPALDVTDEGEAIRITAELAGVGKDDVEISVIDNVVSIRGEKKAESETKEEGAYMLERSYGAFSRSVPLPFAPDPDALAAQFRDGVLTITVPKPPEAKREARRVEISGG